MIIQGKKINSSFHTIQHCVYEIRVQDDKYSGPSLRAQHTVALWCPWNTLMASPADSLQSLAVVSEEAANGNGKQMKTNKPILNDQHIWNK